MYYLRGATMICLGLDTSNNFKVIGVVIGKKNELEFLYNRLIKSIKETKIHASRLRRSKKNLLIKVFYEVVGQCINTKFWSLDFDLFKKATEISKSKRTPRIKAAGILLIRTLKKIISSTPMSIDLIDLDREFVIFETRLRKYFRTLTYNGICAQLADLVAYLNFKGRNKEPIITRTQ